MERQKGTTRIDGPAQGFPEDVSPSTVRKANLLLRQWLNGEVDKMEAITTPGGERIVQSYQRDEGS